MQILPGKKEKAEIPMLVVTDKADFRHEALIEVGVYRKSYDNITMTVFTPVIVKIDEAELVS